jgi:hypothetical protein
MMIKLNKATAANSLAEHFMYKKFVVDICSLRLFWKKHDVTSSKTDQDVSQYLKQYE